MDPTNELLASHFRHMNAFTHYPPNAPTMSSPIVAAGLTAIATVSTIQAAGNPDAYAIIGAMLGTVIIFLEAREKGRSWMQTASSVVGSAFCGAVLPGGLLWWLVPEFAMKAHWQIWAGAGFICGLAGWGTVLAALHMWETRRDGTIRKAADRFLGDEPTQPPDGE